jgi:glyoxylase-like metal-dependent hydrolase (beta-lactamase superfamily II)
LENALLPYGREGVYWIDGEDRVLVGIPENLDDILDLIEEEEIDSTFITHSHDISNVEELQERAGCKIFIHQADGESIKNIRKAHLFKHGEELAPGMTMLHCPGHTPGSSFLKYEYLPGKYCLFTGDTIAGNDGKVVFAPDIYSQDVNLMKDSVKKIIEKYDFEMIFPSWGEPILKNARQIVLKALK